MILRFQRQNLVETSSSSTDSDYNENDPLQMMEHRNAMVRLIAYGRLKKMMIQFQGKPLDSLERNMMKGMFKRRLKDFKELLREEAAEKPLFDRLRDIDVPGMEPKPEHLVGMDEIETLYKET